MEEQIRLYPRSGIRPPNACESRRPLRWVTIRIPSVDTHLSPFVLLFALYGPQYSVSLCANWQHSDFSGHFNKATYLREKKRTSQILILNLWSLFCGGPKIFAKKNNLTENIGGKKSVHTVLPKFSHVFFFCSTVSVTLICEKTQPPFPELSQQVGPTSTNKGFSQSHVVRHKEWELC